MDNSKKNWLSPQMRTYVLKALSKIKEIRCEKCGAYEGLEFHHIKYAPKENVAIKDLKILCNKCHRNAKNVLSNIKTVFENGKRYCIASKIKFEY